MISRCPIPRARFSIRDRLAAPGANRARTDRACHVLVRGGGQPQRCAVAGPEAPRHRRIRWDQGERGQRAQARLRDLGMDPAEAAWCQRIAGALLYCDASLRAPRATLKRNLQGPAALWGLGISGDLPIVLLQIRQEGDLHDVRQLLRAQAYWQFHSLAVDLVVLDAVLARGRPAAGAGCADRRDRGGTGSRRGARPGVCRARRHRAHGVPAGSQDGGARDPVGSIGARARSAGAGAGARARARTGARREGRSRSQEAAGDSVPVRPALEFFNGLGGFAAGGRE